MSFMTYAMILAIYGLYQRPGGINKKQFVESPADYLVISYLVWTILTTGSWFDLSKAMMPFASFYFVTALALNSVQRLNKFLTCWVTGLALTMLLTICSIYGFEIVAGTTDLTNQFLGRLALNTWIYNNPNSLGHGIVALIPAAYIWFVWKRNVTSKLLGIAIIAGSAQVTFLTQSKGAYLCGAAAVTASLMFRRRKIVQIFTLVCVMTAGIGALKLLPRMEELDTKEAGIAGRLLIWQMAYNAMVNTRTGEGWKKFEAWIDTDDYGLIHKATHGSYVNVGADLGYIGLMLFVGILYANGRTLLQAKVEPELVDLERCQRLLLSLTVSFSASAWMIDRAYHTDFFILAGAVAAFHRLLVEPIKNQENTELKILHQNSHIELDQKARLRNLIPDMTDSAQPIALAQNLVSPHDVKISQFSDSSQNEIFMNGRLKREECEPAMFYGLKWRHLQWIDAACIVALLICVISAWNYLMTSFISF